MKKCDRDQRPDQPYRLTPGQTRYVVVKRVVDAVLAAGGLLFLAIPFLLVAMLQKIDSPREPVFFAQERVGWHGKVFQILKFRTMRSGWPMEEEDPERRMSALGRLLRRYSIDELPQLWNVLVGDMALVGPRPLVVNEQPAQRLRSVYGVYAVRPGITGLAQINGRDRLDAAAKVRYDCAYVQGVCAGQDIRILLKTVSYVLRHKDMDEGNGFPG